MAIHVRVICPKCRKTFEWKFGKLSNSCTYCNTILTIQDVKLVKVFSIRIEEDLEKKITKLKKKDKILYTALYKKIFQLMENPYLGKPLRNVLKNKRRVHIGPFVLIYEINEKEKKIVLLKFEHHDRVYK